MLKIPLQEVKDGMIDVSLTTDASDIVGLFPEFFGIISLSGTLNKVGKVYNFMGKATCMARLICDRTLTEFTEEITAPLVVSYLADTQVFLMPEATTKDNMHIIREDDLFIDISVEVAEELALHLPMKRIAPQFRDKDWDEIESIITKDTTNKEEKIDERWSALKNIHLNN